MFILSTSVSFSTGHYATIQGTVGTCTYTVPFTSSNEVDII